MNGVRMVNKDLLGYGTLIFIGAIHIDMECLLGTVHDKQKDACVFERCFDTRFFLKDSVIFLPGHKNVDLASNSRRAACNDVSPGSTFPPAISQHHDQ